jgi:hypothetical protein
LTRVPPLAGVKFRERLADDVSAGLGETEGFLLIGDPELARRFLPRPRKTP